MTPTILRRAATIRALRRSRQDLFSAIRADHGSRNTNDASTVLANHFRSPERLGNSRLLIAVMASEQNCLLLVIVAIFAIVGLLQSGSAVGADLRMAVDAARAFEAFLPVIEREHCDQDSDRAEQCTEPESAFSGIFSLADICSNDSANKADDEADEKNWREIEFLHALSPNGSLPSDHQHASTSNVRDRFFKITPDCQTC